MAQEIFFLEKVHISQFYDDDNDGFKYGIHYYENADDAFPFDVQWFRSRRKRNKKFTKALKRGHKKLD